MKKYAHNSRRLYRLALDAFLYTTFKNPLRSMTRKALRRLPSLASYLTSSLHRITSRAVSDQRLQQLLGFHAVFLGSSPKRAPALYSLMSHLDLIEGVRYPAGGFYSVIAALEQVAREEGVTIRTRMLMLKAHRVPEPHLREGRILARQPGVHAAIDTSDGLSSDLAHIAEESRVGACLHAEKIPISPKTKKLSFARETATFNK